MTKSKFEGRIDTLEIARGHDGLFRGFPDPVLAVGIYVSAGTTVLMLGRSLHRFRAHQKFPSEARPDHRDLPSSAIDANSPFRYLALAVALEEDGGDDVARLYGLLEHHAMLSVWAVERHEVEPTPLWGIPNDERWSRPTAVDLTVDGLPASASCKSDKWIGASCWAMSARPGAPQNAYRVPFLSPDQKNDWTAIVTIAH